MEMANNLLPEERGWEYKQINVTRVPGYGFGIAVSGGRDNPHFASGDPSIAVSDVLASGPAERILQVNDRIISVNGISLQNVDYATAVQVLRDSGDTVSLVIKRRTHQPHLHQHSHSLPYTGSNNFNPSKITLSKGSKKEDFGIVLGCKLFVKEISSKAREQLLATNQVLNEGDFVTKLNSANCHDLMSLKEAKKIIAGTKDKLHISVVRDLNVHHQAQNSLSSLGAANNYLKDDMLNQSYANQNLYVQPPTRNVNLNNGGYEDKLEQSNSGPNSLIDDKSNLGPRSRSRGPLTEQNLHYLDARNRTKNRQEPPRPPPPRNEDFYGSRKQLYEGDPIAQKNKQPIPDARFISFHKEGSVGIRLTGGNFVGIFVTAVQPGSPASLQGLQPGDKILKVNDMDMTGVTREEAVLFLLSLQDRIELIVQFCKEEYDNIVASQKGDSFYIKTHYHYDNPAKGEMSFKSGDIFHVIDTLYNGVVGCWQVFKIGRNNQELQKGIIPNKSRAEELATAQFNATKKEQSTNESRGSFFKRRRSSNRRSKSLGKEHWDDLLFSDTVSKFPAYERVILKHPGFTRPVIMFGPIADMARDKLSKDFHDKFSTPQLVTTLEDTKLQKNSSNIIRLSAIREVISSGKHALLDITPNAVERLNYAQMYPIVIFFKAETKLVIKQLRQGIPKSAHKSSKKLLEQCHKLDQVWSHIFSATITLNDNTDNWYRKVRDIIDKNQSGAIWMSENKPDESLSDDFLFPMSSLRLSYASSPESDLEHSPGPPMSTSSNTGRLAKASSDPSVVMTENTELLPSYQPNYDSRYNLNDNMEPPSPISKESDFGLPTPEMMMEADVKYDREYIDKDKYNYHKKQAGNVLGYHNKGLNLNEPGRNKEVPDLPPRVDRGAKPIGTHSSPSKTPNGRSAHERLFGNRPDPNDKVSSLERGHKSDSMSSYDSFHRQTNQIGPNAHDDLKTKLSRIDAQEETAKQPKYKTSLKFEDGRSPSKGHVETKTDYGKFSRSNGTGHDLPSHPAQIPPPNYHMPPNMMEANGYEQPQSSGYKPIPPPKPKNYKPVYKQAYNNGEAQIQSPPYNGARMQEPPRPGPNYYYNTSPNSASNSWQYNEPRYNSYPDQYSMRSPYESRGHPGISYASLSEIQPIATMDKTSNDRLVDLQSSREQRGSAFELYRKPMHHNLR